MISLFFSFLDRYILLRKKGKEKFSFLKHICDERERYYTPIN